jgi:GntR family transcriptional regulator
MYEKKQSHGQAHKSKPTTAKQIRAAAKWEFAPLDKGSFTPIYFQIQTQLLQKIQSGQLRAGDPLPSEEELGRVFGVSRMTARHALQALKSQGFASRHRGQGTFVSQPRVEKDIAHLCGFTAEMNALGMKPASRILQAETIPAEPDVASRLGIQVASPVFHLRRLRLADDLPVAIEEVWLSRQQFSGIEQLDFARLSLYQTLRERYGIRVSRADEILEARSASRREAELLEIAPRSSLLVISRTLWSVDGKPVESAHSLYRGDRYRAVLQIPATTVE